MEMSIGISSSLILIDKGSPDYSGSAANGSASTSISARNTPNRSPGAGTDCTAAQHPLFSRGHTGTTCHNKN
jgi:hypothetical protein